MNKLEECDSYSASIYDEHEFGNGDHVRGCYINFSGCSDENMMEFDRLYVQFPE